jgi:BolA protein
MSRKLRIHDALSLELMLDVLIIDDESHGHSVPVGSESHFKVVAVSNGFESLSPVARHRLVNKILAPEFKNGLHALSLHLFTPLEWEKRNHTVSKSPECQRSKRQ